MGWGVPPAQLPSCFIHINICIYIYICMYLYMCIYIYKYIPHRPEVCGTPGPSDLRVAKSSEIQIFV